MSVPFQLYRKQFCLKFNYSSQTCQSRRAVVFKRAYCSFSHDTFPNFTETQKKKVLSSLKKTELSQYCKDLGVASSGTKEVLVRNILNKWNIIQSEQSQTPKQKTKIADQDTGNYDEGVYNYLLANWDRAQLMKYCQKFNLTVVGDKATLAKRVAIKWESESPSESSNTESEQLNVEMMSDESSSSNADYIDHLLEQERNNSQRKQQSQGEKSLQICGKRFYSYNALVQYFHKMLWRGKIGKIFRGSEKDQLLEVLSNHQEVTEKVGAGVRDICIGVDDKYDTRCFRIIRQDDSQESFSYRKTLQYMWYGVWAATPAISKLNTQENLFKEPMQGPSWDSDQSLFDNSFS
eukprot:TRINITY_DN16435_c2_g2_i1.p1 TRINITY_DN16435_c2_g2~~TRINITY_DN16435_c2_g2_i1.p1  ORF type:complete len:359 (-),score=21.25 TRINITY_DN16435_c2_g2_i1:464-1510(-)